MLNTIDKPDYASLSYADLKAHRDEIDAIMAEKLEAETANFRDEIARKASALGIHPAAFFAGSAKPPRYRHPDDPSLTWTGKGRAPTWITQLEDNGHNREDFLIE